MQKTVGLALLALILAFSACKPKNTGHTLEDLPSSFSETKEKFKNYVAAYTAGMISKATAIQIRLTNDIASPDQIDQAVKEGVLSFQPAIEGKAIWSSSNTIKFVPKQWLPANQLYKGTVDLGLVYSNIPKELKTFTFDFKTISQQVDWEIKGVREQDINDPSLLRVLGTINTTDAATPEEAQALLKCSQAANDKLLVNWEHNASGRQHKFEIINIQRNNTEGELKLSCSGTTIGATQELSTAIAIPNYDFKVLDVKVMQEETDAHPYVMVLFSQPLQAVVPSGLVKIESNYYGQRYVVDGNELRVYPSDPLEGNYTLKINAGILSIDGAAIPETSEHPISFESIRPTVRLVGEGVIIPKTEGLYFPFEAINLKAVDVEIFKIYQNNVLHFLQADRLSGDDTRYVGRIISQKRVNLQDLKPVPNGKWTRYALNLDNLIKEEAGAIYQVRIAFRKEYATYNCIDANESALATTESPYQLNEDGEFQSLFAGRNYWDYDYSQRNDPCTDDYYNNNQFVKRNVLASNLGIIAKEGKDKELFIAITDLLNTEPISGVAIELYDDANQLIGKSATDAEGIVQVKTDRSPRIIVASHKGQKGYLRLTSGHKLSVSKFPVSGTFNPKGIKGKIYGERGVWRPGDSLYLTFVLEDKLNQLPDNHPVTFTLKDSRDQLRHEYTTNQHVNGMYSFHVATAANAPTGSWYAQVEVGGSTFSEVLKIETVKPNRLKINVDLGKNKLNSSDKYLIGDLNVKWLHGAPAADIRAQVDVMLTPLNTSFEGFEDYEFDDPARSYYAQPFTIFNGNTNDDGLAKVKGIMELAADPPGHMRAGFTVRAFEKGGEFSSDNFSMPFSPYSAYVGIKGEQKKFGEKRLNLNANNTISLIVLDEEGKPLANRKVRLGMYKVAWRWWWDSGYDNIMNFNKSSHLGALETKEVNTDENGLATWDISPTEWGRYLIRACDVASQHCSGEIFYAGTPWGDDNFNDKQAASMLAFSCDKEAYNIGEEVEIQIPAGKMGRALLTIENSNKILSYEWITIDSSGSKDGIFKKTIQTTPEMSPTAYVNITLLQEHAQSENDLPIRSYGIVPIRVEDPNTRLKPVLDMADVLEPNSSVPITVKEESGKEMTYTIAMVDEGLLDLTRFETPALWDHFYAKEALGVSSWDMYNTVLGAHGVALDRILTIGGGSGSGADEAKKANRFKAAVRFIGPFHLEKGQTAKHNIQMPNYIGSVRTMVVAAQDGSYGKADKTTPVRKPLMVLGTLPRVLSPTEQVTLPVTVFAMEDKIKEATVTIETNDLIKINGKSSKTIKFKKLGDQILTFDLAVQEKLGIAKVKIIAKSGDDVSEYTVELDVRNPNPYLTQVYDQVVEAGQTWSTDFEPVGMNGTNSGILEISSIPPINLEERLGYLIRYPYGCIEQTVSSVFPQLYVGNLIPLGAEDKAKIEVNIKAAIKRLPEFQVGVGAFAYWAGNTEHSDWGSCYAGHFLLEAQERGYSVPKDMLKRWQKYQKSVAQSWSVQYIYHISNDNNSATSEINQQDALMQAYRLYTLALAKKPEMGAMNRMLEIKKLAPKVKWRLAAAYALVGKKQVAQSIVKKLPTEVETYQELAYTYGSDLRDEGMILETLTLLGDKETAAKVLQGISKKLSSQRWYSTQTTAYSLMAVAKFVGKSDPSAGVSYSYQIAGGQSQEATLKQTPIAQYDLDIDGKKHRKVSVKNNSKGMLFARVITAGQPLLGNDTEVQNDVELSIEYKTIDGKKLDPKKLPQGTDFMAVVEITNPGLRGDYEEMVLHQVFPSGWEIINMRMNNAFAIDSRSPKDYQDVRDDRVYTYFDIPAAKKYTYTIYLNAAYQGHFYMPNVSCSAMYDNTISANKAGQWVDVTQNKEI